MKYNINAEGLGTIFKPYQEITMKLLWENRETFSTRQVTEHVFNELQKLDPETHHNGSRTISRASIINFLKTMEEESYLKYTTTTGKGGYRRLYHSEVDENGFKRAFMVRLIDSANKNFLPITLNS